jgi:hypothetical protein
MSFGQTPHSDAICSGIGGAKPARDGLRLR